MSKVYDLKDRSITTKIGETFKIELESTPTSGYQWQPNVDPEKVKLIDRTFESSSKNLGAAGKEILTFQTLAEGDIPILLDYKRVWESDSLKSVTFNLRSEK